MYRGDGITTPSIIPLSSRQIYTLLGLDTHLPFNKFVVAGSFVSLLVDREVPKATCRGTVTSETFIGVPLLLTLTNVFQVCHFHFSLAPKRLLHPELHVNLTTVTRIKGCIEYVHLSFFFLRLKDVSKVLGGQVPGNDHETTTLLCPEV